MTCGGEVRADSFLSWFPLITQFFPRALLFVRLVYFSRDSVEERYIIYY